MSREEWEAWLELDADEDGPPPDGDGYLDPEDSELPWGEDLLIHREYLVTLAYPGVRSDRVTRAARA
jgi:hypothetical protein